MADKGKSDIQKLFEEMLSSADSVGSDVRKNVKEMFGGVASRFDLVTREEFKVQQRMLAEAIKKLERLEKKLADKSVPKIARKPAARKSAAKSAKKSVASKQADA